MAFLTALTELSHFSCSVVPGGFPQDWNVSSHVWELLALVGISLHLLDSLHNVDESSGVGGGVRTLNLPLTKRTLYLDLSYAHHCVGHSESPDALQQLR